MSKPAVKQVMKTVPCGWNSPKERAKDVAVHRHSSSIRRPREGYKKVWYQCLRDGCQKKFKSGTTRPKCPECDYGSVKRLRIGD